MEFIAAPFGSDEFNFIYYGIEGDMFNWDNGAPLRVTNGNETWSNGLNSSVSSVRGVSPNACRVKL
jgi:putative aldouronate transport system substrate-binding protein